MSNIDKQALREAAEGVDRDEWEVLDNGDDEYQVIVSGSLERGATYRSYRPVANEISKQKIAAFIAAFNPETVLALLDELEAAEKRIAELEARTVTLPAQKFCPSEYMGSVLWSETEVWNQAVSECAKAIRAAGIGKGE